MKLSLKAKIKFFIQGILGFRRMLYLIARFRIHTMNRGKKNNEFFHFLSYVKDNSLVLDVGANIGVTAFWLARSRPRVQVAAFEPVADNVAVLRRIIKTYRLENDTLTCS